jgi:hypothetical protein
MRTDLSSPLSLSTSTSTRKLVRFVSFVRSSAAGQLSLVSQLEEELDARSFNRTRISQLPDDVMYRLI